MMKLTTSVVICVYTEKRIPDIDLAVASLRSQARPPEEIVIVVDHNATLQDILQGRYEGVSVIPSTGKKGLSGARNSGVSATSGDVILFLDDDAEAEPGWVAAMTGPLERDQAVDIVSGKTLSRWDASRPAWFPPEFDWAIGATYAGMPDHEHVVRNPFGGNAAWRRRVFDSTPGFREGVGRDGANFAGCEETELAIRYRHVRPATRFVYTPDARIHHRVTVDRAQWGYFLRRCWAEGRSKAQISAMVGAEHATEREVGYVLAILLPAVAREISAAASTRRAAHLMRVGAMLMGLGSTATAFAKGRVASKARTLVGQDSTSVQRERSDRSLVSPH